MEGKEARFGIANSALWATVTTSASNGSVNSMHDSFMPLGGLVPLFMIQLGEIIYGGVGSGLYGMLAFVIVAVFVAGLMVGRTPEYLGKKIEAYEMKMASLMLLIPILLAKVGTAIAVVSAGRAWRPFGTPAARTDSARCCMPSRRQATITAAPLPGLGANTPFYNTALGICMFFCALLAGSSCAGDRGITCPEEESSGQRRDAAHAHAAVRGLADWRDHDRRRAELHPGAVARADR